MVYQIGVVGANGAGKTTLLNLLYGAISPRKGSIARNGSISYFKQLDQGDVEEVQNGKLKKELGIARLAEQEAISGGENTRVRLADVLSGKTNVVFVDEPTSNLDRSGITLVRHKLEQIETFVLISHDRAVLAPLCNRIVEIEEQTATVYDMGYEDYFYGGNLCFLEWPELIEDLLPEDVTRVHIHTEEDGSRTVEF